MTYHPPLRPRDPDLLTVDELGHLAGLGRDATRAAICRGDLPGQKIGARYVIRRAWVDAWLAAGPRWREALPSPDAPIPFLRAVDLSRIA